MKSITVKSLLTGNKARLGITSEAGCRGREKNVNSVQSYRGLIDSSFPPAALPGTILVLAPTATAAFDVASGESIRQFLGTLPADGITCMALAGVNDLPDFLVRIAEQTATCIFGSRYDEHLLASRLVGLLREKLHRRLFVQGALVNVSGRGVLITGISGAGKTTLALELARRGHTWIADDAVEIEQRCDGRLYGRSHALVKNLLEIKKKGILPVRSLPAVVSIADETPIDLVAQIGGRLECKQKCGRSYSSIMGVPLPLVNISQFCFNDRDEQIENAARTISQTG